MMNLIFVYLTVFLFMISDSFTMDFIETQQEVDQSESEIHHFQNEVSHILPLSSQNHFNSNTPLTSQMSQIIEKNYQTSARYPVFPDNNRANNISESEKFVSRPINKELGFGMGFIDRDFFPVRSPSYPIILLQGSRVIVATGFGFLFSMPATAEVMILVGNWVGADVNTTAASCLAGYIALKSTLLFANVWDDMFKEGIEFLHPIYVIWTSKDEETIQSALKGKFSDYLAPKDTGYYASLLFLVLSSGAYAFPPLWQMLWSIEQRNFPTLSYFTMPILYFSLARIFFETAKANMTTIPSTAKASVRKEALKDSIHKFLIKAREDKEFCEEIIEKISGIKRKRQGLSPLMSTDAFEVLNYRSTDVEEEDMYIDRFRFSLLFLVHEDADLCNDIEKRTNITQELTEEIKNPLLMHRLEQVDSLVYGLLGIGSATLYTLLHDSFQSLFTRSGISVDNAFWISFPIAIIQSASFIKATNSIYLAHGRAFVETVFQKSCRPYPPKEFDKTNENPQDNNTYFASIGRKVRNINTKDVVRYIISSIPNSSSLATGVILSLADLKRGLETYATYTIPEKVIGAGFPFLMGTLFMDYGIKKNLSGIYRKIVTNLPSRCLSLFDCCRVNHDRETLEMYGEDALDFIEKCSEETRDLLFEQVLQQQ